MTNLMIARISTLIAVEIKESLSDHVLRFADDFGLKVTKDDITRSMGVNTCKVPKKSAKKPSETEFMSILIYLYVMSFQSSFRYTEEYLDYLDIIFHQKCYQGELRMADILFYEIFSERL